MKLKYLLGFQNHKTIYRNFKKLIVVALITMTYSCNKTPDDACDCLKNTANEYIVKGVKISSIDDLREPCKNILDKFKDDATARAKINDCAKDVFANWNDKVFNEVKGKKLEFPSFTFNTPQDFINELSKDFAEYKYWKTNVEVKGVYISNLKFSPFLDSFEDSLYLLAAYPQQGNDFENRFVFSINKKMFDVTKFSEPFYSPSYLRENVLVWDTKELKYIDLKGGYIRDYIKELLNADFSTNTTGTILEDVSFTGNYNSEPISIKQWYKNRIDYIVKDPQFTNFISDMKTGRYKLIGMGDFESVFGKGNLQFCLSKADIKGTMLKTDRGDLRMQIESISNIIKLPSNNLMTSPGKSYDFSSYMQ